MTYDRNPLALDAFQRSIVAKGGTEIALTPKQVAYLRKNGLVADAHETYRHPSGSFALLPRSPARPTRARVNATVDKDMRTSECGHCGAPFMPIDENNRYCSVTCGKRARAQRRRSYRPAA